MQYPNIAASRLPSFLLPCPHCGHRMVITAVAPAQAGSDKLEDVTHSCVQCGTTLTRTIRLQTGDAHTTPGRL
jgi:DNA-directed RNA polymerase subunit RPC12/RpoP